VRPFIPSPLLFIKVLGDIFGCQLFTNPSPFALPLEELRVQGGFGVEVTVVFGGVEGS